MEIDRLLERCNVVKFEDWIGRQLICGFECWRVEVSAIAGSCASYIIVGSSLNHGGDGLKLVWVPEWQRQGSRLSETISIKLSEKIS